MTLQIWIGLYSFYAWIDPTEVFSRAPYPQLPDYSLELANIDYIRYPFIYKYIKPIVPQNIKYTLKLSIHYIMLIGKFLHKTSILKNKQYLITTSQQLQDWQYTSQIHTHLRNGNLNSALSSLIDVHVES